MTDQDQSRRRPLSIWGAYGGMNIGDEAILVAMIDLLRRHGLDPRTLIVQSPPEPDAAAAYRRRGLEPVAFRSLGRLFNALRRTDLVCGGGQLMDDRGGLGFPVGFTSCLILANRVLGGRPIIFGIGAEPMQRGASKWLVKRFYSLARLAMVRDRPSHEALVAAGYPEEQAAVGGDVAMTLHGLARHDRATKTKRLLLVPNRDPQRVGNIAATFDTVVDAARGAGWGVTVMAHDRRPEYDVGELDRMRGALGTEGVEYVVPTSLNDGYTHYQQADVVVSARMHPLLLSILHGVTPVAIPVVAKVRTLVADLSLHTVPVGTARDDVPDILNAACGDSLDHVQPILAARVAAIEQLLDRAIRLWQTPKLHSAETSGASSP